MPTYTCCACNDEDPCILLVKEPFIGPLEHCPYEPDNETEWVGGSDHATSNTKPGEATEEKE